MDKQITPLEIFLKNRRVYDEFVKNRNMATMKDISLGENTLLANEYIGKYGNNVKAIIAAFDWDIDGNPNKWSKLDTEWHKFLTKYREKHHEL